jgi:hypothetical protein
MEIVGNFHYYCEQTLNLIELQTVQQYYMFLKNYIWPVAQSGGGIRELRGCLSSTIWWR